MKVRLVFALFPLLFLGFPAYAQSPCSDCLKAAEVELKNCADTAISTEDKISCEENRQARMKACGNGVCKIERDEVDQRENRNVQRTPNRPGLTAYTPTKIEWLALAVNSRLRQEASADLPYSLSVVQADHETLLIVVRYHPPENRRAHPTVSPEIMNRTIDTAREVIMSTAKSYGWDNWVKIRESVEIYPPKQ